MWYYKISLKYKIYFTFIILLNKPIAPKTYMNYEQEGVNNYIIGINKINKSISFPQIKFLT